MYVYKQFKKKQYIDKCRFIEKLEINQLFSQYIHGKKIFTKIARTRVLLMYGDFTYHRELQTNARIHKLGVKFVNVQRKTSLLQSLRFDTRIGYLRMFDCGIRVKNVIKMNFITAITNY